MGAKFLINMLLINYSIQTIYTYNNIIIGKYSQTINQLVDINTHPNSNLFKDKIQKRIIYFNLIL